MLEQILGVFLQFCSFSIVKLLKNISFIKIFPEVESESASNGKAGPWIYIFLVQQDFQTISLNLIIVTNNYSIMLLKNLLNKNSEIQTVTRLTKFERKSANQLALQEVSSNV